MNDTAAYDDVAEAYHTAVDPEGSGLDDPHLVELVGDVQGARVLSLACGQGRDARLLADLGADVVGVDVSEGLLTHARRLGESDGRGIDYQLGDAHELTQLTDDSFDGVVCYLALMDIPRLDLVAGAVARVLRPGGWFVTSVVHPCFRPHLDVIDEYLTDARYAKVGGWEWLPSHAYHRPLSSYVNTLARAGLLITQLIEPPDDRAENGVPNLLYLRTELT